LQRQFSRAPPYESITCARNCRTGVTQRQVARPGAYPHSSSTQCHQSPEFAPPNSRRGARTLGRWPCSAASRNHQGNFRTSGKNVYLVKKKGRGPLPTKIDPAIIRPPV
jgi:hypothetical protein